jgi:hypothetical protein
MKITKILLVAGAALLLLNCGNKTKYFHLGSNPVQGPMAANACEDLVKMAKDTGSGPAHCSDTP